MGNIFTLTDSNFLGSLCSNGVRRTRITPFFQTSRNLKKNRKRILRFCASFSSFPLSPVGKTGCRHHRSRSGLVPGRRRVQQMPRAKRQKGIWAFPEFRVVSLRSKGKVSPLPAITRGQDIASTGSGMEPSLSLRQSHASITL